ncbi:MAG: Trk family potassium uptake protein [Bdellovibrio sp.]|nr:Trk family potassium uptake protein [Bdellovibrio sp.]
MRFVSHRLPVILELLLNGPFIVLFALQLSGRAPAFIPASLLAHVINIGTYIVPFVLCVVVGFCFWTSKDLEDFIRRHIFSLVILLPLFITFGDKEFAFWLSSAHFLSTILSLYEQPEVSPSNLKPTWWRSGKPVLPTLRLSPAQIVLLSFAGIILLGTFLLALPVSAPENQRVSIIDALFMSTSATCVTGLSTISVKNNLSLFGQMILLGLIQVGGLGFMTLASSLTILMGRSTRMRERLLMQDLLDVNGMDELYQMIVDIMRYTFFIELWGAIILAFGFSYEGLEFSEALYSGFFYSISAFCNAGFGLWDNSFESYATSPLIHGTIAVLIILGGLGFIVLRELREMILKKKIFMRLSLHTKIVFTVTGFLLLAGTLFIFFGEFLNALDDYSLFEKIQIAFFQSVTLRTAGFNTIPLTSLHPFTAYGMMLFMFIGGSPGSTAGGIKTTTFAILVQSIRSTLKGQRSVTIFDRTVQTSTVVKSVGLTFISIIIICFFVLVMMRLEPNQNLLTLMFEIVSAFGTVGLSLGATAQLSVAGKVGISLLMYIGRVGPLTMAFAVGESAEGRGKVEYPDGRLLIG